MQSLKFYFNHNHHEKVVRNNHDYFNGLLKSLQMRGFKVSLGVISEDTPYVAGLLEDYAILDKLLLDRENCITVRRAIYIPYWSYENAQYRDGFRLYKKRFNPNKIYEDEAQEFAAKIRKRNIGVKWPVEDFGEAVFIPLQGRLQDQRYGQSMSPLDMIRTVREHEPDRELLLSLHPGDDNSREALDALEAVCKEVDARVVDMPNSMLMRKSKYVATMNSSLGFEAMVWGLPVMLFADADFHHMAVNVKDYENISEAFEAIHGEVPDFSKYIKWYLDDNMISARKPNAIPRTIDYLKELGLPVQTF